MAKDNHKLRRGPLRLLRDCFIALAIVAVIAFLVRGSDDSAPREGSAQQLRAGLPPEAQQLQAALPAEKVKPMPKTAAAKAALPPKASAPVVAKPKTAPARTQAAGASKSQPVPKLGSRVYFPDLLIERGIIGSAGMEVGAAKGRFSDFLLHRWKPKHWILIDPRLEPLLDTTMKNWKTDPVLQSTKIEFLQGYSTDEKVLSKIPEDSFDFIYIDAAHDYENVKKELPVFWDRLRSGGLLAGHDYCGKKSSVEDLSSKLKKGRPPINPCGPYTDFAAKNPTKSGKIRKEGGEARDQIGVVKALLEWMHKDLPNVELYSTAENFTRASLAADKINYDDIITSTRNPSWYLFKP